MKKISLSIRLSIGILGFLSGAFAASPPSNFTPAQVAEIKKIVGDHLLENTALVMTAMQTEMEKKQKEEIEQAERTVAEHKDKIFKATYLPTAGNPKGKQSLVVFLEPYCGYCRKLHEELPPLMTMNKDVKIIFVDVPIMGDKSVTAVKALFAAHRQGKYAPFQNLMFQSKGKLNHKKLVKTAKAAGMNVEKFEADMKSKEVQALVDKNLALAEVLKINATPFLIINETNVVPGYVSADEINKLLTTQPVKK